MNCINHLYGFRDKFFIFIIIMFNSVGKSINNTLSFFNGKKIVFLYLAKKSRNLTIYISDNWKNKEFKIDHSRPNYVCSLFSSEFMSCSHKMNTIYMKNNLSEIFINDAIQEVFMKIEDCNIKKKEKYKNLITITLFALSVYINL